MPRQKNQEAPENDPAGPDEPPEDYIDEFAARFQRFADRSSDVIYRYDIPARRFTLYNKAGYDLYGIPMGRRPTPKDIVLSIHPEDRDKVRKALRESLAPSRNGGDVEYRKLHADDGIRWMNDRWIVLRDLFGQPIAIEGIVRDNTRRKNTEQALKESEQFTARLLENSPVPVLVINPDTSIRYMNPALQTLTGFSAAELIGEKAPYPWWTKESLHQTPEDFEKAIHTGHRKVQDVFQTRYGHRIWLEISSVPVMVDGQFKYYLSNWVDVSERKRMESRLFKEKEKFRMLVEKSPFGVALIGKDDGYRYVNPRFEKIFGYTLKDIPAGRDWFRKAYPDKAYRKSVIAEWIRDQSNLKADELMTRTYCVRCSDGSEKQIRFKPMAMESGDRIVIYEDVTERSKLEMQLQQAQKMEAVSGLAGGLAHDFNNLLSIVLGNISLAKEEMAPQKEALTFIDEAEKAILRARDLSNKFITFSSGGAPIKKAVHIDRFIRETVSLSLSGSNITCAYVFDKNLWPAEIDPTQMQHAFLNIIENARHSMPDGGTIEISAANVTVVPDVRKPLSLVSEGDYIKIAIKDTGKGISQQDLQKVFDPYFSTKPRGTQKGMGLGLAITYSIVNRHNGYVFLDSRFGQGTEAYIYLPASRVSDEVQGGDADTRWKPLPDHDVDRKGRILVMDDEESLRVLASLMLTRMGFETALASDGEEAVDLYRKAYAAGKPFDAVIMDLTVKGGMGGQEAVRKLIDINPDVRAVISSGYFNDPVMANYRDYGFCGVIPKPYEKKDLENTLKKVLL